MFCIHCGKEIADNSEFCSFCGEKCNSTNLDQDAIKDESHTSDSKSNHYSEIPCPFCNSRNSQPTGNGHWTCLNCGRTFIRKEDAKFLLTVMSWKVKLAIASIVLEIISIVPFFSILTGLSWLFYAGSVTCWFTSRKPVPYYKLPDLMQPSELEHWQSKRNLGKILLIAYPVIILIFTIIAFLF